MKTRTESEENFWSSKNNSMNQIITSEYVQSMFWDVNLPLCKDVHGTVYISEHLFQCQMCNTFHNQGNYLYISQIYRNMALFVK